MVVTRPNWSLLSAGGMTVGNGASHLDDRDPTVDEVRTELALLNLTGPEQTELAARTITGPVTGTTHRVSEKTRWWKYTLPPA